MTAGEPPFLSVLVPCWNAEATIERGLDSVLEVRSVPIEVIVIDDASTDRTAELANAVAARDDRVTVVRLESNGGASNARNRGLELVRGEWLTMLDADDRFLPGGLAALVRAAQGSDATAVIGQQVWWDGRRRWLTSLYDIPDIRRAGRKSLAASPGLLYAVSPHAKLFHRSTFEGLRFSGRVLGDQPWIIRALLRAGDRIDVLDQTVYEWFRPPAGSGPASITSTTRSSARRGVEAAEVAGQAFAAVADEARRLLDPAGRDAVLDRYAERLIRSDLGIHLVQGLARRDPTLDELIGAIARFIGGLPAHHVRASDALSRDLLEPVLRRWGNLDSAGRTAFRELAVIALDADPSAVRRRPLPARLAAGVALRSGSRVAHAAAALVLTVLWLGAAVIRRIRRRLGR